MKNLGQTLSAMLCLLALTSQAINKDTVIIEFGDKSKMLIIAPTAKDFKILEEYDINQMVADLNSTLDTTSTRVEEFTMVTPSASKLYTQDTTKAINQQGSSESYDILYYDGSTSSGNSHGRSDNFTFNNRHRDRTEDNFQIEFGLSNWLSNGNFPDSEGQPYAIKPWGSWYFGLGFNNKTQVAGPLLINWGGNIAWSDWKMQNKNVRIVEGNDRTEFIEDDTIKGIKSKLTATYINASFVPMLDFGYSKKSSGERNGTFGDKSDGFRIGVGGYAGYRIGSHTKFVYEEEGDKNKDKNKDNYYLNSFRYGLRGEIGYKGLDFFFNYDMNEVFATDRGPKLNAISFGIIL